METVEPIRETVVREIQLIALAREPEGWTDEQLENIAFDSRFDQSPQPFL